MTDDPDVRIATSVMDYIFRRLALDHLPYEQRAELGILSAAERAAQLAGEDPAAMAEDVTRSSWLSPRVEKFPSNGPWPLPRPRSRHHGRVPAPGAAAPVAAHATPPNGGPHSTAELIESQQGRTADAPLCLTCGTKMHRPAAATSAKAAAPPVAAAETGHSKSSQLRRGAVR